MKKSLLTRWIIILVLTISWCWSIFPVRDRDFLGEFNRLATVNRAQFEKLSGRMDAIRKKQEALKDKNGADFKNLAADLERLKAEYDEAHFADWDELNSRIANLMAGKDLNGQPLPNGQKFSAYKALEKAAQGDGDQKRSIRLNNFIKVPHQARANNKTVLRYIRRQSAGKLHLGLDLQGGTEFVISFNGDKLPENQTAENVRDQILEILRNRLDKSGITEPELRGMSATDISIRMPSIDEADKTGIRSTIKDAAKLEFYLVAANNAELVQQYAANPDFRNPANVIRKEMVSENRYGEEQIETIFLEKTPTAVRGADVKAAFPNVDEFGRWSISMSFNERGTEAFGKVTGAAIGRRLAIVLDDTVYSAPVVNDAITGGNAQITGSFTIEEARRLAGVISSGNLPVSIELSSEFGTAPTLGTDSIRSGVRAGILGLVLVVLFMLFYYRFCGVVANIALAVNTMLVLGTMALTGATITMPGIAGMVLTIGMAVDANVLIFERIRDEQRLGKALIPSISAGYSRAFSAIFDSNLTTLITCFFLYKFGSGTVQGFAVTLAFGVIASMFTALYMTHAIFDLLTHNGWLKSISMFEFKCLRAPHIDFHALMKWAVTISIIFVLVGVIGTCCRKNVLGIDFAGGTRLNYSCDGSTPDVAAVRAYLHEKGYADSNVGYKKGQSGNLELEIMVASLKEDANLFSNALDKKFSECKMSLGSIYQVGPSVGSKFRNSSILAAGISFLAIIIYLAFRFELTYGIAAVVAVIHDVLVAGTFFIVFFHGQISLTVVAALMTIIGYSLNDTIVIFDRIRELRALHPGENYHKSMNDAINSTLSRTLMTTVTTMFVTGTLLAFGGGVIRDFALVMFMGLIVGTWSSLMIAPSIASHWHKRTPLELAAIAKEQAAAKKA